MKIDVFNHIFPKTYFEKMLQVAPNHQDMGKRVREIPVLVDLEQRFRVMDQFADYAQVSCLASPRKRRNQLTPLNLYKRQF